MKQVTTHRDDVSLVIAGEAGQGIQTVEKLLTRILKLSGYHVFATREYMSRVRGGSNSTEIRISSRRVTAYVDRIDVLIALDEKVIPHLTKRITTQTIILGEKAKLGAAASAVHDLPFSNIAAGLGSPVYANIVAVGTLAELLQVDQKLITDYLTKQFSGKGAEIVKRNIAAATKGYELGASLATEGVLAFDIARDETVKDELILDGAEAIGLGAVASGCNFIGAYPMSPSTGILTFLSKNARNFGIVAEQVEDEISGINMGIGAWYAGARALVTTSGGGYELMTEGLSLAGMIEMPMVISLGMRPGPATGLPTRTEQGDLNLALYTGHGEFPRAIFAPGTLADAFHCSQRAFNVADQFQVPAFILNDQYLIDSFYNIPALDPTSEKPQPSIVETTADYKRYQVTANGISARGIPGWGAGLVQVDSDEHDESGQITEDFDVRKTMVEKRLKKFEAMQKAALPPELIGPEQYDTLVVLWGTNVNVVREALLLLNKPKLAGLYCKQVWPLHSDTEARLKRATTTVVLENNATGQFANLLKQTYGHDCQHRLLKYNGVPFSVEEVVEALKRII